MQSAQAHAAYVGRTRATAVVDRDGERDAPPTIPALRPRRGCAALTLLAAQGGSGQPLSIGTTPVFLDDDVAFLRDWQAYLQRELGRPVVFVQRRSYREVSELLLAEKLDAAWICGYPYVRYRDRMRLLAVPDL